MIVVERPGLLSVVMDLGRVGYQRQGIVVGGAADRLAVRLANALVGNPDEAAILEITQTGPTLRFERPTLVAWVGADVAVDRDGQSIPGGRTVSVSAGETLAWGRLSRGTRTWVAVAGGLDVPVVLGSRSTVLAAGFGGHEGRTLRAGDRLPLGALSAASVRLLDRLGAPAVRSDRARARVSGWSVSPRSFGRPAPPGVVRVVPGPEWDWFSAEARDRWVSTAWRVTRQADRMGARLEGPALTRVVDRELISEAAPEGAVQVPANGQPIVLLADHQTVGGYPRIGCVITADLGTLAQLAPGDEVRFESVTLTEAHACERARERDLGLCRTALGAIGEA